MSPTSRRMLVVVVLGIAIFAAFSIYADVSELGERLAGFGWWAFGAAIGLAIFNYGVRWFRWELYLKNRELSVRPGTSLLVFLSGFALSITPGKVGELIKCYLLRETDAIPLHRTAPIVIAERVTDLVALLLIGLAGFALHGVAGPMVFTGSAIILGGLGILAWPRGAQWLIRTGTTPAPLRRFRTRAFEFYSTLSELVRPGPLSWSTGLGVIAWLAECVGFALIIAAFPGTDVPLALAMLIYAATTIAGALSFLPGGLLITEASMTLLLVQVSRGVDEPTAVAATILTRLATLWLAVVIGVIALAALRRLAPRTSSVLAAPPESSAPTEASTED